MEKGKGDQIFQEQKVKLNNKGHLEKRTKHNQGMIEK